VTVVHLLVTDPAYQRKGLASKLLKHGLDLADAEDRQAYIEATRMGHPVYLKLGFRDVDSIEVDLRKWGGEGTGRNTIMLREPQPKV
jgi:GNAT superfamily N-acetyltransferase